MKTLTLLALLLSSTIAMSSDSCMNICKSDANQMGLKCQKLRQICFKLGSPESSSFEMCMDDVASCLQEGKAIFESCTEECRSEESK